MRRSRRPSSACFGCECRRGRQAAILTAGGHDARHSCLYTPLKQVMEPRPMAKTVEHVHWPDAPDLWMPYAPAIKVKGGTTVYLAGVTAAPVYHHHPHRPEEFDAMPRDMAGEGAGGVGKPQPTPPP